MHIELLKDVEEFSKMKGVWEALCEELGDSVTAFSSFVWYETWWRHYSAKATLNVVAMWEADKLVGVAPLMVRRVTIHGLPTKVVCFIENNQSPHNDFIVLPSVRELFLREVMRILSEQRTITKWDAIVFNKLPVTSANYHMLVKILDETGVKWRQEQPMDSPYLIPSGTWMEFLAGRSTKTRKTLRNIQNSMHKAGEVSVRNIRTWEEFLQLMNDVYFVGKQSWTGKIGDSLVSPVNKAFFSDLAQITAAKGWMSLWTLYLNGKMIALEFHLRANGKEHAIRGHYLPEFATLSPGTFLELNILKNAFEEADRVQKYDFCGNADSYKRRWTEDSVPHMAVMAFSNGIYSRFVAFHEAKTVPLLRRVFPQNFWNHKFFKLCGISTSRVNVK